MNSMKEIIKQAFIYSNENLQNHIELLKSITSIPSPSGKEEERAKYIKDFLKQIGIKCIIDEVNNVIVELGVKKEEKLNIYMAHIDTVFDYTKIDVEETSEKLIAPGVGDDTANVATLLMVLKFIKENKIKIKNTVFVFDSCEEGLGNLKGARAIIERYKSKIEKIIAFDLQYKQIINRAVGSRRYKIEVKTEGGHSYLAFGNKNSIEILAKIIEKIYEIDTSKFDSKTTYNVGKITGGTSVNTIAQYAEMLYEFRSESEEVLEKMEKIFYEIIEKIKCKNNSIEIIKLGNRPATGKLDEEKMKSLTDTCKAIIERYTDESPNIISASTDCNLPLSMGIPAICIGTYDGSLEHTKEEYVMKKSLQKGFMIALEVIMRYSV